MYLKNIHLVIFVSLLLAVGGCTENGDNDTNTLSSRNASIIEAGSLGDINKALENGPVLVEIGSPSCSACKAQKPIMEEIAADYTGRASVVYINTAEVGALGFSIYYVPDSFVINGIENGTYVYMKSDGQKTTNRLEKDARFVGLTRKAVLTQTLDHALTERSRTG